MSEPTQSPVDALIGLVRSQLLDVNTSIPGTVVSYANGRANVKPQPKKRFADGDVLEYPVIPDVRVCWPSFACGTAGVKGPVKSKGIDGEFFKVEMLTHVGDTHGQDWSSQFVLRYV